jgi:hypothetical protein
MTLIKSSITYQLNELGELTKKDWNVALNPGEDGGVITQPNGIEVFFNSLNEALSILSDTLEIVRTGDTKWCLE